MGRSPCSSNSLKKGPRTPEEDEILTEYIQNHGGHGSWRALPKRAGLNRCGKSCRLRWCNYLRPDIKRGNFTENEEQMIINLHSALGNKWSQIAAHLPGRTDNEIKNFWNTRIRKKLVSGGTDPKTHQPIFDANSFLVSISHLMLSNSNLSANPMSPLGNAIFRLKAYLTQPSPNIQLLLNLWQLINSIPNAIPNTFQENTILLQPSLNLSQYTGLTTGTSTSPTFLESLSVLQNRQVNPKILSENFDAMNALAFLGEESKSEFLHSKTSSSITSRTSSVLSEDVLPELASTSSTPVTFGTNQMDTTFFSTASDLFEDCWGKLIDVEEESDSFWKNLLISN